MIPFLITIALVAIVAGQLLLKLGLNRLSDFRRGDARRKTVPWIFVASILSMTLAFFLNVGLLQKLDLSYLFPFQDLSVILIALCSTFFLREKLSRALIVGVLLITAGVILVSAS